MRIQLKKVKWKKKLGYRQTESLKRTRLKKLNNEYNVCMFSPRLCGGKVFIAEQKIREVKRLFFKPKSLEKRLGKRTRPNKLIVKSHK